MAYKIPLQPDSYAELLTYDAAEGVQAKVGDVIYVQDGPGKGHNWRRTDRSAGIASWGESSVGQAPPAAMNREP